jgi:hypothetical protein
MRAWRLSTNKNFFKTSEAKLLIYLGLPQQVLPEAATSTLLAALPAALRAARSIVASGCRVLPGATWEALQRALEHKICAVKFHGGRPKFRSESLGESLGWSIGREVSALSTPLAGIL